MHKVIMAPTEGSDNERAAISVAVELAQQGLTVNNDVVLSDDTQALAGA